MTNPPTPDNDPSGWSAPGGWSAPRGWGAPNQPGYHPPVGNAGHHPGCEHHPDCVNPPAGTSFGDGAHHPQCRHHPDCADHPSRAAQDGPPGAQPGTSEPQYGGHYGAHDGGQPAGQHHPGYSTQHPGYGGHLPPPQITPQPGIIPLQPLGMGQIFDGAIKALRANPVVMFLFSAILMTISTVVELLLTSRLLESTMLALDQMDNPEAFGTDELSQAMSQGIPSALLGFALTFLIGVVLTGILTYAVSQAVLGFKPTLGQVWEAAKGRLLPLVGLTLLVGLLLGVPITVVVIAILAAAAVFPAAITVLLAFVAFFVVLAWAVVLIPVSTLATPALMLEGSSPITALRRGWALAKPYFWRILGIYLLTSLLAGVISSFITTPASIAIVALPTSAALVVQGIVTVIATTLVTPFVAAVGTLLYIDVRIRREGLAVELAAGAATGQ